MNKLTFVLFLVTSTLCANDNRGDLRVMFYNVENLFDTYNDSLVNDDEFTPQGLKHWTYFRYEKKLNNIYKIIVNTGQWSSPDLIGLCEVENYYVLTDLVNKTNLYKYPYKIAHFDSPDRRGIDVGLLYRSDKLELLTSKNIPVNDVNNSQFKTRDILYASFISEVDDTLHVFVNHWPSRRGGANISEPKRLLASLTLCDYINSLSLNHNSKVIIMGDFNDNPENESVQAILKLSNPKFYNLSDNKLSKQGTIKYQGSWSIFDQIIVTNSFFLDTKGLKINEKVTYVADFEYVFEKDQTYSGNKPFTTYAGYLYKGGFSDHLPVFIDVWYYKK